MRSSKLNVVGKQTECDKLSCEGKHTEFTLFFHKVNNTSFYCLSESS